jgi:hypothetical protein
MSSVEKRLPFYGPFIFSDRQLRPAFLHAGAWEWTVQKGLLQAVFKAKFV